MSGCVCEERCGLGLAFWWLKLYDHLIVEERRRSCPTLRDRNLWVVRGRFRRRLGEEVGVREVLSSELY